MYLHAVDYVLHRHAYSLANASSLITALTTLEGRILCRHPVRMLAMQLHIVASPGSQARLSALLHTDTLANGRQPLRFHDPLEDFVDRAKAAQAPVDPKARAAAEATLDRLRSTYNNDNNDPSAQHHELPQSTRPLLRSLRRVRPPSANHYFDVSRLHDMHRITRSQSSVRRCIRKSHSR